MLSRCISNRKPLKAFKFTDIASLAFLPIDPSCQFTIKEASGVYCYWLHSHHSLFYVLGGAMPCDYSSTSFFNFFSLFLNPTVESSRFFLDVFYCFVFLFLACFRSLLRLLSSVRLLLCCCQRYYALRRRSDCRLQLTCAFIMLCSWSFYFYYVLCNCRRRRGRRSECFVVVFWLSATLFLFFLCFLLFSCQIKPAKRHFKVCEVFAGSFVSLLLLNYAAALSDFCAYYIFF